MRRTRWKAAVTVGVGCPSSGFRDQATSSFVPSRNSILGISRTEGEAGFAALPSSLRPPLPLAQLGGLSLILLLLQDGEVVHGGDSRGGRVRLDS